MTILVGISNAVGFFVQLNEYFYLNDVVRVSDEID